jgi:two-component system sensor histidine kinase/response regulator
VTLPRFETVARLRPVDLVVPGTDLGAGAARAPYVAVEAEVVGDGPVTLTLRSGGVRLTGRYDGDLTLSVTAAGRTTQHRSRRAARPEGAVEAVGLTLTGTHVAVFSREGGVWTVRGRVDLSGRVDTRDEAWLAHLTATADGKLGDVRSGGFGQLGLRDLRLVTHADGTPYRDGDEVLLTATSAGPGFFDTAHTSVWALEPDELTLHHRADLFFRRPDQPGVFGDHATHLLRDGDHWLVATSTWGDFDRAAAGASVGATLGGTTADLTHGRHVLDTRPLALPTTGLRSVGVWDPHLVRDDDTWLVTYVSARRFFAFHPVLATGPSLDALTLRAAATRRRATEGPTLARLDGAWHVLASDGRDGRSGERERYPVFDLDLTEVGALDAPYHSNIPWPTLLPHRDERGECLLLVGFDGTRYGGRLVGYGSHGDVVVARGPGCPNHHHGSAGRARYGAEDAMVDTQDLLRSIAAESPDGLWVVDGEGATVFANQRMAEILGRPGDDLRSVTLFDVVDDDGRAHLANHLREMRDGHPGEHNLDSLLVRCDGSRVWTLVSWAPLPASDGTILGWLHRVSEYAERKGLLEALQDREHQLAAAQALAHLGSWEWTTETGRVWWSDELHRIFGLGPDEFEGTYDAFVARIHEEDRPQVEQAIADAFAGGQSFAWEARILRPDGDERWVRGLGLVGRDATGAPVRMSGTAQDITDLVRASQEAAEATRRLHLLARMAEAANQSSSLSDALGHATGALDGTSGWEPICVFVREEPEGPLVTLPLPLTSDGWLPEPDVALAERSWRSAMMEQMPLPGHEETHTLVAAPVVGGPEVACVIQLVADEVPPDENARELIQQVVDQLSRVAERERSAADLAAARDSAMEASRLKSEFLATMSHEIRTPMNGVIGLNDLLLRTELDERQRRLAEGLRGAGLTLLGLINDILDLSKIESGKLELEAEDIDIRSVFEQTAAVLAGPAHEKGLELVVACHPDVPVLVNGDSVRLGQILTNLGSNAVKFTDRGEVSIRGAVAERTDEDLLLRVEVTDTGIGISESDRVGLFEAFTQADLSTTRQHGGTGLGLAISQRLAHALGGEIGIESTPGLGSTFWFTARLRVARSGLPGRLDGATYPMRGRRVLVVDDNETSRAVLLEQLGAWHLVCVAATTGEEAMEQVHRSAADRTPFDAVLLDLTLDATDGLALAARLRAAVPFAPPMLLLTRDHAVSGSRTRAAGIAATLTKPVGYSDLYDALLRVVIGETTRPSPRRSQTVPHLGVRTLVVEDNAVNQMVATGLLEALGCRVDVVGNGVEAVERLRGSHEYDVVLMDCRMPLLDGYDATKAVRAAERDTHVPIIAMTASALEGERERCLEAGMDDFLTKPVDPSQLARALFRWVPAARRPGPPEAPGGPDGETVLDPQRVTMLGELVKDGVSFFERTRTSFLSRVDLTLAEIRGAIADADASAAEAAAHQLKGSALNIGLVQVGAAAGAVETYAGTGSTDGIEPLMHALAASIRTGVDALAAVQQPSP